MPLELLKQLVFSEMPVTLLKPEEIDKLRILRAAGMVRADISDSVGHSKAIVHEVTMHGQQANSMNKDPSN